READGERSDAHAIADRPERSEQHRQRGRYSIADENAARGPREHEHRGRPRESSRVDPAAASSTEDADRGHRRRKKHRPRGGYARQTNRRLPAASFHTDGDTPR